MKRATLALAPQAGEQEPKRARAQLLVQMSSLAGQQTRESAHVIHIGNDIEDSSAVTTIMEEADTDQSCDLEDDESMTELNEVIAQHMDITEPLTTLRSLLEQRMGISLANYSFYLQDTQELDASKNLVNQCVQGEGLVQVNLEILDKGGVKKINIVDVLKPADEVAVTPDLVTTEETEQVVRWVVSPEFKAQQEKFKIPNDPTQWSADHVKQWIQWAIPHFGLISVEVEDWNITGKQLCEISHSDFTNKVPCDPGDLFWTHLELLRKCQIVAVVQQPTYVQQLNQIFTTVTKSFSLKSKTKGQKVGAPRVAYEGGPGNRAGNNGQIQLWQFLLEMLTDKDCRDYIRWLGEDGEFKLLNPEMVAQLWGLRKNKPTMNYEKLSRALRYYYDGDMIAKVHGKRFVYKFVCDLKSLLGYSAAELNRLVEESFSKRLRNQDCQILVPISASGLSLDSGDS